MRKQTKTLAVLSAAALFAAAAPIMTNTGTYRVLAAQSGWTEEVMMRQKMFQVQKRNSETLYLHTAINKTEHTKTKRRKMQEHGMSRRL